MVALQYLLVDDQKQYPCISYYEPISKEEILLRFSCDYWIKDHKVYQVVDTEIEGNIYSIYVIHNQEEKVVEEGIIFAPTWQGIQLEYRHFHVDWEVYPVIHREFYSSDRDVLLHLLSTIQMIKGKSWQTKSTEVDENRKKYIIYVSPVDEVAD